jgi:hypothetical protein
MEPIGSSDIDGKARGRMSGSERVKITEDVRKFAAQQGITEEAALEEGLKTEGNGVHQVRF